MSAANRPSGEERNEPVTCDSCGRAGEELVDVHRVYATPESWDTAARVQRLDDTERWCFACLSHYPHERVTADD